MGAAIRETTSPEKLAAPAAIVDHVSEDVCPYRGLAAFGESDAKNFFGRSAEVREAMAQLATWPLLAIVGPSGVGKSSFVHAGLIPAVRASDSNWWIRVLRPGRVPLQSLANVLEEIGTEHSQTAVIDQLRERPGRFGELLRAAVARSKLAVMIVVDQLEELFTLCSDDDAHAPFLTALLLAAHDDPSARVRVVLSMRADFLDRLAGHKQFLAELPRGLFFLSAPDHDSMRETLVRPAQLAGYVFEEPSIVENMMQTATSRGALPLLQFAMTRLWDRRDRSTKTLTCAAYAAMGGVGGAFVRHADEVAASIPPQRQALLKAILTRLVTPEGTRAVIDRSELAGLRDEQTDVDQTDVDRILDQLLRARLIHVQTDPKHGATVEIVHEVLITKWPTLRRWLEDSSALRGFLDSLRQAVRQWITHDRAADLVWRGAVAQDALSIARRHVLDLSAAEAEFLAAVRAQAARGRRLKVTVFASIFAVLALVIAGGAVAVVRISKAQRLASDHAIAAELEAKRARTAEAEAAKQLAAVRTAEAETAKQLAAVRAEEARRAKAEAERKSAMADAINANRTVQLTHEELQKAYENLRRALEQAQNDKRKAEELGVVAKNAADTADALRADAMATNAKLQVLLARERERVRQLEIEMAKISTGRL